MSSRVIRHSIDDESSVMPAIISICIAVTIVVFLLDSYLGMKSAVAKQIAVTRSRE